MKAHPNRKHLKTLCAACVVAAAALAPVAASAHTSVFLGLNLSGLFAPPPVVTYRTPGYYVPAPTYYYAPRTVIETPSFVYYRSRSWFPRRWRPVQRHDWRPSHRVRHWHGGHREHGRHGRRSHHWHH